MTPSDIATASERKQQRATRYDELRDASGLIRPHWKPLTDALTAMTPEEYARPPRLGAGDGPRQRRDLQRV